jgi:predicted nucleic acid-binding Zn ribbon protein
MDQLIKSLPRVLRAAGNSPDAVEAAVLAVWLHATGDGIRQHATANSLDGTTLIVDVRDTVWQQQLKLMQSQLIYRINTTLGQALVNQIELRVNPTALPPIVQKPEPREILDNEVPLDLWSAASEIEDKQLRQKFLQAAMGMLRRKS